MSEPARKLADESPPVTDECVRRTFDPCFINTVVNHPAVYPHVRGMAEGRLDLTPVVANPRNFCLMGEYGGVLFVEHQVGLYEAHTQVVPEGRGAWTLKAVRAALHYMFTATLAVEIVTRVPRGNLAARALVRAIGGVLEFHSPNGWVKDGAAIPADIFALRIQDWIRIAPGLPERGQWFHDRLEQEYARHGKSEELHADDAVHDRYVGAAVDMVLAGQQDKAAIFYNRWAAMAGYAPIAVISSNPIVIDIRDALIGCRNGDLWVIKCQ